LAFGKEKGDQVYQEEVWGRGGASFVFFTRDRKKEEESKKYYRWKGPGYYGGWSFGRGFL